MKGLKQQKHTQKIVTIAAISKLTAVLESSNLNNSNLVQYHQH